MIEIWKDIKDYEGLYQVSNLGRVKSFKRKACRIMKPYSDGSPLGYLRVDLQNNGRSTRKLHLIVYSTFNGTIPEGSEVDHIDNDATNNKLSNLQSLTSRENSVKRSTLNTNNSSTYTGVTWDKGNFKWKSQLYFEGKQINLGRFNSEEEASEAYQNKLSEILGR